ncbi:MAG: thioredoxin domain-containing protein [Actinobacteria bacterium]|nr:thioredoxin domain-containing protein [Actinomycetota bacterium]
MRDNSEGESCGIREEFRFSPRPNRAADIAWMNWGEAAFARAAAEGKPVLLSISAVWCHWCHVMDETTYSDPAVIEQVNRLYVPVRVDSDRNPDINRRYNQGGWPTTAFLDHHGNLLAGATYIPPETMRTALQRIAELYRDHEVDVGAPEQALSASSSPGLELSLEMVEETGAALLRAWDRAYGGLGREPKFPQVEALALALDLYSDEGNGEYLVFAGSTLESMIRGNLLDKVEGGFFRYSTTRDWSIPHYEKMLADNAMLIPVLLRAYAMTGSEVFRRTASETAAYIYRTLSDGEARFFGSQDADEEYYLLPAGGREGASPPPVDRTVYTDLAARAASSFLAAGAALENDAYIALALAALEYLWSRAFLAGVGMAHYLDSEGRGRRHGFLGDLTETASAFLAAYGYTGDGTWMERARTLLELAVKRNWSEERSAFMDVAPGSEPSGLTPLPAELPAQSRAAHAMLSLWAYGDDGGWRELAGKALEAVAPAAPAYGFQAAPFALATNLYLRGPLILRLSGPEKTVPASMLRTAALSAKSRTMLKMEPRTGTMEGKVTAELCARESCLLRVSSPEELKDALGIHPRVDIGHGSPRDAFGGEGERGATEGGRKR